MLTVGAFVVLFLLSIFDINHNANGIPSVTATPVCEVECGTTTTLSRDEKAGGETEYPAYVITSRLRLLKLRKK
jgi:hypothetical protein